MDKRCYKCKESKETTYFSNDKSTSDGLQASCKACNKKYRDANKLRRKEARKVYEAQPVVKEKIRRQQLQYYQDNKDVILQNGKRWRNVNSERKVELDKKWRRDNPERVAVYKAKRRAEEIERTPSWADEAKIVEFYKKARQLTIETGIQHHVDHIIPLKGEIVSGLHVENNLQILTRDENLKKSNKVNQGEI